MRPSSARASAAGEGRRKTRFAEAEPGCRSSRERGSACAWAGARLGMANAQRQAAPAQASPIARRPALAAGTTPKLRQTCSLTGAWRGTLSSTPTRSSASATSLVSGGKGAGQSWEGVPRLRRAATHQHAGRKLQREVYSCKAWLACSCVFKARPVLAFFNANPGQPSLRPPSTRLPPHLSCSNPSSPQPPSCSAPRAFRSGSPGCAAAACAWRQ
jgi:hypothetical protein